MTFATILFDEIAAFWIRHGYKPQSILLSERQLERLLEELPVLKLHRDRRGYLFDGCVIRVIGAIDQLCDRVHAIHQSTKEPA